MPREERRALDRIREPIAFARLGRDPDLEGSVFLELQILEREIARRASRSVPGPARVDLELDARGRAELSPDTIGLAAANRGEGVALVRVVTALAQPPVEDPEIGIVGVLPHLGLEPLRDRSQDVAIAADALGLVSEGGRPSDVVFDVAQGRDELVESPGQRIVGPRCVGRRRGGRTRRRRTRRCRTRRGRVRGGRGRRRFFGHVWRLRFRAAQRESDRQAESDSEQALSADGEARGSRASRVEGG